MEAIVFVNPFDDEKKKKAETEAKVFEEIIY